MTAGRGGRGVTEEAAREGIATTDEWSAVRDDHHCFGCGRLNPHGLHLSFGPNGNGGGVSALFVPGAEHEGYAGVVHGGIVTALLDEAMAWAAYARGVWVVTARIDVRFRRPVEIGTPVRAVGRVVADRGRIVDAAGEVRRESDGGLLAEGTAVFARVPAEQARLWQARYLGAADATSGGGAHDD